MKLPRPVHIVHAKRSPIGRFGGALASVSAADLAVQVADATLPAETRSAVDHVILGQVLSAGTGMNVARQLGLRLSLPQQTPAYTVNMVCGSGLRAVTLGAQQIALGESHFVLTGGVESMSNAPFYSTKTRFGSKLGDAPLLDAILTDGLSDPLLSCSMGETAENLAAAYKISRGEQDAFALLSQQRAALSGDAFARELVSICAGKDKCTADEQPRPATTLESLAKLRPAFAPDGTVTAGNASSINDGAAMISLASSAACERYHLQSRAEIVGYATTGCDPALMGLGPVRATRQLCTSIGWKLDDVEAIELNEAFAVQSLACIRDLKLTPERVNQRGGAIALGHPIGASGARVLVTLLHLMEDNNYKRGIAALCVGGGMGIAVAIQR